MRFASGLADSAVATESCAERRCQTRTHHVGIGSLADQSSLQHHRPKGGVLIFDPREEIGLDWKRPLHAVRQVRSVDVGLGTEPGT